MSALNNTSVLTIGGSRNIGYFSSIRLLDLGATVTFLLRKPNVFDADEKIQNYVRAGKARLVQGDALVKEDVRRAWTAAKGDDSPNVDYLVFTVGGLPHFELTKGFVISPPDLVTRSLINCLETLPCPHPRVVAISSNGLTRSGHAKLPFLLKPVYNYLLPSPHADKCGAEEVAAHCAGWVWKAEDSVAGENVLPADWRSSADLPAQGSVKSIMVIRPALLTDGACRADEVGSPASSTIKKPYKVGEGDLPGMWTVSRKDVAHFVVEGVIKHWDEWGGRRVSIAY